MKKYGWLITVGSFVVIFIVGMIIAYPLIKPEVKLKVYQPSDINPKLVDSTLHGINRDHRIADFEVINQLGNKVTSKDFEGKIYVADFFFATCPSICPVMSGHFAELQEEFADEPRFKLLSFSVTPELDTVEVLRQYGEDYGADPDKWVLATGDKKHIYELARKSYFAVLDEGDGGVQDFIHTENFVLVDSQRRIRGYYDGTSPKDMKRLSDEIRILLAEEAEAEESRG